MVEGRDYNTSLVSIYIQRHNLFQAQTEKTENGRR